MWPELESNQRHKDFQSSALPTELSGQDRKEKDIQLSHYLAMTICISFHFSIFLLPQQVKLQFELEIHAQ
jgi:hypothetical protein